MEAQAARPFKKANEDDWVCADAACGNINFAWRTSCNRCSKEKVGAPSSSSGSSKRKLGHEIGKHIAEKSHGLFSPDDWQCNKCGNVNWARRSQCNMCNAPKFGEVEERTGLGGGYNERGTVEYKQRTKDEDDEYDDFGRRKKPRNPGSSIHSEDSYQGNLGSSKDKNGGDEDEEEEDEDRRKPLPPPGFLSASVQEYLELGKSIPGRPGSDYPILSVVPYTDFYCDDQPYPGFFADTETRCQAWHYCDIDGRQASFLCPNGTQFSQAYFVCDWWFNVRCDLSRKLYAINARLYQIPKLSPTRRHRVITKDLLDNIFLR
uniref:Zinc finger Ran-binding domain-containing protein 2 n=1 Tax=Cacopsylla melanoneura TaxID=428564 RepID=A0A8D8Y373_9HEMI